MDYAYQNLQKPLDAIDSFKQAADLAQQQGNIDLYQTSINEINQIR